MDKILVLFQLMQVKQCFNSFVMPLIILQDFCIFVANKTLNYSLNRYFIDPTKSYIFR